MVTGALILQSTKAIPVNKQTRKTKHPKVKKSPTTSTILVYHTELPAGLGPFLTTHAQQLKITCNVGHASYRLPRTGALLMHSNSAHQGLQQYAWQSTAKCVWSPLHYTTVFSLHSWAQIWYQHISSTSHSNCQSLAHFGDKWVRPGQEQDGWGSG